MTRRPALIALLVLALAAPGCSLLGGEGGGKTQGGKGGGPGGGPGGPGGGRAPSVVVGTVVETEIQDTLEAVGTARANEQADLNSTVTERIARINFADGAYVPRGAVIAELVRDQQGATQREALARLTEAQLQLERLKQLQGQGFATKARIDQQQAAVDVARAQAQQAGAQISDRVIRAPFSGWLSLRRVSPGEVVNAGTTIVTIVDHSRIKLDFTVPETFVPALRPGLEITARAAAFPGETFRGRVASVDPVIDPVTRAATARAILPNPDLRLRPGMLMTVDVKSPPRTALTVPELAVIGEGSGAFVWKVGPDNEVARTPVSTGGRRDGRIEITQGLAAGDRVVTEGTVKIRGPGPIRPVEALAGGPAPQSGGDEAGAGAPAPGKAA
ncbi:MAG: efflux RND transporter periplasmic adaptor subunit [Sphingomonadaceae bacterium]